MSVVRLTRSRRWCSTALSCKLIAARCAELFFGAGADDQARDAGRLSSQANAT